MLWVNFAMFVLYFICLVVYFVVYTIVYFDNAVSDRGLRLLLGSNILSAICSAIS